MQNEAVDRNELARQILDLLTRPQFDPQLGMKITRVDPKEKEAAVSRLLELFGQEIYEAIAADATGRVLCGMWLIVDPAAGKIRLEGDLEIVRSGIRWAVSAALKLKRQDRDVASLIRSGVTCELAKRRDEKITELRSQKVKDLLPKIVEDVSCGLQDSAAVLLDHLSPEQRADLKHALYTQLSESPVIHAQMDREPEDVRLWVYWYLHHSVLARPKVRQDLGGLPKDVLNIRRGAARHKAGEVVFPLGPMYAQVFMALGGELNKHGHDIGQPQSVNRIAKSLKVSHGTAKSWLAQDLPGLMIRPDGEGGVLYDFTPATVARCVEIVVGRKRGPSNKT